MEPGSSASIDKSKISAIGLVVCDEPSDQRLFHHLVLFDRTKQSFPCHMLAKATIFDDRGVLRFAVLWRNRAQNRMVGTSLFHCKSQTWPWARWRCRDRNRNSDIKRCLPRSSPNRSFLERRRRFRLFWRPNQQSCRRGDLECILLSTISCGTRETL